MECNRQFILTMKKLNLDEIKSYLTKIEIKNYMLMVFIK